MQISRREFLLLTAGLATGCQAVNDAGDAGPERLVNAGPAGDFAADGVYTRFRDQGFFLVRRGGKLFALSAICTHRKCKLDVTADRSFACPCHGSTFDAAGHVTTGPARRDLPVLAVSANAQGQLLVTLAGS